MTYSEDVRGVVIGDILVPWSLHYDGRQQGGGKKYAATTDVAIEAGKALMAALKAEYGGFPCYLYPDDKLWEVRLYNQY